MKIFVDTNIFLDMLFKREGAKEASMVFKAVKNRVFEGVVADITIVNINYIARKFEADIRTYLKAIEKNFIIVGANNNLIKQSLLIDNLDLEDNIQYTLALDSKFFARTAKFSLLIAIASSKLLILIGKL